MTDEANEALRTLRLAYLELIEFGCEANVMVEIETAFNNCGRGYWIVNPPASASETVSEPTERLQFMIANGNPVDGFGFVGPFPSPEDAVSWAGDNYGSDDWWMVTMAAPECPPEGDNDENE